MESLDMFKKASGLVPSIMKSTVFFCNVPTHAKQAIMALLPFEEGKLPIKYLGVPLISSRLLYKDCKILVENLDKRIANWQNKSLSFAGRLQLINSVLSSLHVYWASVFILPARIIKELEKRMRGCLWTQGEPRKGKSKASWNSICMPKYEGGLGIRKISEVNNALMIYHIWSILTHRQSLWVNWVHLHKLKGRSFWDITPRGSMSWSWRKLLKIRPLIRSNFKTRIGDGTTTFAWHDNWSSASPMSSWISNREITRAGFSHDAKVIDIVEDGAWKWPVAWLDLFPVLLNLQPPILEDHKRDSILWYDHKDQEKNFSSSEVWETIRTRQDEVQWVDMVWFSQCVPRFSFHMWLIFRKKLKTQDRMRPWDVGGAYNLNLTCCPLCQHGQDTHNHLFFECHYSSQVWTSVKDLAAMTHISAKWEDIVNWLIPISKHKTVQSIVGRLVIAATSYFIWQERNARLFSNKSRSEVQLHEIIIHQVRLKHNY